MLHDSLYSLSVTHFKENSIFASWVLKKLKLINWVFCLLWFFALSEWDSTFCDGWSDSTDKLSEFLSEEYLLLDSLNPNLSVIHLPSLIHASCLLYFSGVEQYIPFLLFYLESA